jgi:hypothetical protein
MVLLFLVRRVGLSDGSSTAPLFASVAGRLSSYCLDDAIVCRAAVVHEGLDAGHLDRYAAWQLLGRLLASFFRLVDVPASTARGSAIGRAGRVTAVVVCGSIVFGVYAGIPHPAQPVVPGDVAAVDQDCLIVAVVAQVLEEDAAAEQRDLQRGDVDVGLVGAPRVCAYAVGQEGREEAIEVEEEEDGEDAADEQFNEEDPA